MSGEWQTLTIDQIKAPGERSIAIGPFGSRMKVEVYVAGGVPVIRGTNISDTRALVGDFVYVSDQTADELRGCNVYAGDLVFPHRGAIGQVAIVPDDGAERYMLSTSLMKLTCDTRRVDPKYVLYYFRSELGRHALLQHASTVGTPGIGQPLKSLRSIRLPVPPLTEQHAIAQILGTLDDKIELNRRMSETLEAMAQALFKSWFVDFDPVRAKSEGRDPGLPRPLADLFPDSFEDSMLGETPRGWGCGCLGDVLAELVSGGRPKGGAAEEGVPSIGAGNVIGLGKYDFSKEKYVPREFYNELRRRGAAVKPGDVLLYKDGARIGRKSYFDCGFPHTECAVNEHAFIVRGKRPDQQRFLFFWLDQDWMTQMIISLNSNSAQPGINQQGVRSLSVLTPPDCVLEAFDRLLSPISDRLFKSCLESRTLAAFRDTLLPKLISGELRVARLMTTLRDDAQGEALRNARARS